MKNYIGFVNDHSGSMAGRTKAAIKDYNTMIRSVRDAASREMLDTIVSTVGIGLSNQPVQRQVVNSNPHVLKEVKSWRADGMTPLFDGVMDMVQLFESLPDAKEENVSFLVSVTTDGGENGSYTSRTTLRKKLKELQASGRWTFVFRVPKGHRDTLRNLGIPQDNIQEWETSAKGMEQSTAVIQAAMDNYFTTRAAGVKSSTTFYADASKVDTGKPTKSPIPKKAKAPTPSVNGGAVKFFQSRDDARHYARAYGLIQRDLKDYPNAVVVNPEGLRWFVIL